jgi:phosphoribosylglycinamide formyltransferase-1
MRLQLGVLLSGSGSNLQAVIDRIEQGSLQADIRLVLANRPGAYGLQRAARHSLPTRVLEPSRFSSRQDYDLAVAEALKSAGAQTIALAGYMRLVTAAFIQRFQGQVLNIHPALLPSFKGLQAQKQAVDYGVRIAGATVHFVDEQLDHGPIILQAALPVTDGLDEQELSKRILALEHRIYPQALQWLAEDRLSVEAGRVRLREWRGWADTASIEPCLVSPGLEPGF